MVGAVKPQIRFVSWHKVIWHIPNFNGTTGGKKAALYLGFQAFEGIGNKSNEDPSSVCLWVSFDCFHHMRWRQSVKARSSQSGLSIKTEAIISIIILLAHGCNPPMLAGSLSLGIMTHRWLVVLLQQPTSCHLFGITLSRSEDQFMQPAHVFISGKLSSCINPCRCLARFACSSEDILAQRKVDTRWSDWKPSTWGKIQLNVTISYSCFLSAFSVAF